MFVAVGVVTSAVPITQRRAWPSVNASPHVASLTILRGDSHDHSVALGRSSDTRWEPIDRCCHLSFNTVKWMTHCQHSVQMATQLSYCPWVVPALVRSTRAFASNFPQNAARFPPYAGRCTVRCFPRPDRLSVALPGRTWFVRNVRHRWLPTRRHISEGLIHPPISHSATPTWILRNEI